MIPATSSHTAPIFDGIAPVYDRVNTVLSAGTDRLWRRAVRAALPRRDKLRVLDVATGTGEIAFALLQAPQVHEVVGVDASPEMLAVAARKAETLQLDHRATFEHMDALDLRFADGVFDVATIAFGLRNLVDPVSGLQELRRVLRPGGKVLVLEFSLPEAAWIRRPFLVYFRHVLPRIGGWLSGHEEAYRYLNRSVEAFPYGDDMASILKGVGFGEVRYTPLSFGIATLYEGVAVA